MARLRGGWTYDPSCGAILDLMLGPTLGELTVEQLAVAWEVEGDGLMADCRRNPNPGWRPWGWWAFSAGEEKPDGRVAEARRLAELGELWPEEIEALEQRARDARDAWCWRNADRFPQVAGWWAVEAVEVWEAVVLSGHSSGFRPNAYPTSTPNAGRT